MPQGLTFSVVAGDKLAVVGPNGSGKSTLLKVQGHGFGAGAAAAGQGKGLAGRKHTHALCPGLECAGCLRADSLGAHGALLQHCNAFQHAACTGPHTTACRVARPAAGRILAHVPLHPDTPHTGIPHSLNHATATTDRRRTLLA